ncbi:SCP-2 sterol transfer family protein [Litoreibacter meonggei]|uniref:SCP-2 sterol transfer family protein n=1 Tax=Litoreibacter meonggei TaxID=1049199 RepID=A0A497WQF5_9RHOB|nr:SCP2 sterol-binding domain-containing protein [Litoreibacter meonggei]RLJ59021.1 SCP-2 sterol transfer family protein [Litoreibacter meonggei]
MSSFDSFIDIVNTKAKGAIKGTAKLVVIDHGAIILSEHGAAESATEAEADVTLKATEAVFRAILSGDQNPITAVMSGKLKVDGNQMRALKVSEILTS